MQLSEHAAFAATLHSLGLIFRREVPDDLVAEFWELFRPWPAEVWEAAVRKAKVTCRYFPAPKELAELGDAIRAEQAGRVTHRYDGEVCATCDGTRWRPAEFRREVVHDKPVETFVRLWAHDDIRPGGPAYGVFTRMQPCGCRTGE